MYSDENRLNRLQMTLINYRGLQCVIMIYVKAISLQKMARSRKYEFLND